MSHEPIWVTPTSTAAGVVSALWSCPRPDPVSQAGEDWDRRVASWDAVAGSSAFQRLARQIVLLARPCAEDRVVDLGAGTGLLSLALAPRVASVDAIDASAAMLGRLAAEAASAGLDNVRPLVADLRSLPLPDESITLAVSNYAFHHLDDAGKELALSEARRVLVPGGRLVLCDMMFALSLRRRDRALIVDKLRLLAGRGPAGAARIARNVGRLVVGRWEQPAPQEEWQRMLLARHFADVSVQLLEHEGGIALAWRPAHAVTLPAQNPARTMPRRAESGRCTVAPDSMDAVVPGARGSAVRSPSTGTLVDSARLGAMAGTSVYRQEPKLADRTDGRRLL